jgi:hypothetical protein
MKKNVGTVEKVIRLLVAAVFIILFATKVVTGTLGIILLVLAGIFIFTSLAGWCPIWALFKISTVAKKLQP